VELGKYLEKWTDRRFPLILAGARLAPETNSHGPVLFWRQQLVAGTPLSGLSRRDTSGRISGEEQRRCSRPPRQLCAP